MPAAVKFDGTSSTGLRNITNVPSIVHSHCGFFYLPAVPGNGVFYPLFGMFDATGGTYTNECAVYAVGDGTSAHLNHSATTSTATGSIAALTWYFWELVYRGVNSATLYWKKVGGDTCSALAITAAATFTVAEFDIGTDGVGGSGSDFANVIVAGVRLWSGVNHTQAQVEQESRSIRAVNRANLTAEWDFERSRGGPFADKSGHGWNLVEQTTNNTVLTGGPKIATVRRRNTQVYASLGAAIPTIQPSGVFAFDALGGPGLTYSLAGSGVYLVDALGAGASIAQALAAGLSPIDAAGAPAAFPIVLATAGGVPPVDQLGAASALAQILAAGAPAADAQGGGASILQLAPAGAPPLDALGAEAAIALVTAGGSPPVDAPGGSWIIAQLAPAGGSPVDALGAGSASALATAMFGPGGVPSAEAIGGATATPQASPAGAPSLEWLGAGASILKALGAGLGPLDALGANAVSVQVTPTMGPAGIAPVDAIGAPTATPILVVSAGGVAPIDAIGSAGLVLAISGAGAAPLDAVGGSFLTVRVTGAGVAAIDAIGAGATSAMLFASFSPAGVPFADMLGAATVQFVYQGGYVSVSATMSERVVRGDAAERVVRADALLRIVRGDAK